VLLPFKVHVQIRQHPWYVLGRLVLVKVLVQFANVDPRLTKVLGPFQFTVVALFGNKVTNIKGTICLNERKKMISVEKDESFHPLPVTKDADLSWKREYLPMKTWKSSRT
jgi:hypothetical protein